MGEGGGECEFISSFLLRYKLIDGRRKIKNCRQTSVVGLPPLFRQWPLTLTVDLIRMIFCNFVNANVGYYSIACRKENEYEGGDTTC